MSYPPPDNSPEARFFKWFAQSMKWFVIEELRIHKWHLSSVAGRNLGMEAIDDWEQRFWINFCRWRRFEHIEGEQCWIEFNGLDFAVLRNRHAITSRSAAACFTSVGVGRLGRRSSDRARRSHSLRAVLPSLLEFVEAAQGTTGRVRGRRIGTRLFEASLLRGGGGR